MLIARIAGTGSQRLSVAASIPPSAARKLHVPPSTSISTAALRLRIPIRQSPGMLRGAVEKHEQENALVKAASKPFFDSSPPKPSSQNQAPVSSNPSYRNPLKPSTTSALNGVRSSQSQKVAGSVKRTASGLAKALDGTFEDAPGSQYKPIFIGGKFPEKASLLQVSKDDFIDEDDFDSDIDLDVEEPTVKNAVKYPKLPQQAASGASARPAFHPTLPKQQQVQTNTFRQPDSGYGSLEPPAQAPPRSSAPLPWSSSPAEHYTPARSPSVIKNFTYQPPAGAQQQQQHRQNGPPPPQQKPSKRRTLPWLEEESTEDISNEPTTYAAPSKAKSKSVADADATPAPKRPTYPWNTTASAIKDQQKKHRDENRKALAVKKNDGDEESLSKAKSNRKRPARVFLSEEQQHVLDLVVEKKQSCFFTGSAGTGKSVLMREIISQLRKRYEREPDRVAVTASTGLAACNIGGVTLHSFAGIGLGKEDVPELVRKIKRNQKAKHRWMRTKVLVVDEVSMVDGELFDKLEGIARQIRNNGRPFGGIQLVITGDFFQLPPVPDRGREAKFAFDAGTWSTCVEHTIALHHVFRQKDPIFAGMLNEMREGRLQQSSIKAFGSLSRPLGTVEELEATELFATRNEVEVANQTRLNKLQGEVQIFEARDGGAIVDKAQRDKLLQNCMAPDSIVLKKGAQVMLIKNIDESLVNGSIGKVVGFMDEKKFDAYSIAEIDGEAFPMAADGTIASSNETNLAPAEVAKRKMILDSITTSRKWPVVRFIIADGTSRDLLCQPESWKVELPNGEVQASRNQIPLILAWALSIHKAQGQTLERVKVDLGKVFEKGQAYVALSRATSMAGLQVLRFDPKKVNAHERVRTFYSNLSRVELAEKNKGRMSGMEGKKGKAGTGAEEYEKRFLEEEWKGWEE